jgi:hypothetical protein
MAVTTKLNGRMDKRLRIAVVVHLAPIQNEALSPAELTYTEDVSAHGACVFTERAWNRGELAQVTSFKEQIALRGRVVHCRRCREGGYSVGLTFQEQKVTWPVYRNYAAS